MMPTIRSSRLSLSTLLVLALGLAGFEAPARGQAPDPWETLTSVRESLVAAGSTGAQFVQTYVPSGFSSGERETGRLSIALPQCLRWDYDEPYSKSFLICDDLAHYWNADDKIGRRYEVDRAAEPGLDLVMLGVGDLEKRYTANLTEDGAKDRIAIRLTPIEPLEQLEEATLVVDSTSLRLAEMSYRDSEGNQTRFEISGYGPLEGGDAFAPPQGIEWRTD